MWFNFSVSSNKSLLLSDHLPSFPSCLLSLSPHPSSTRAVLMGCACAPTSSSSSRSLVSDSTACHEPSAAILISRHWLGVRASTSAKKSSRERLQWFFLFCFVFLRKKVEWVSEWGNIHTYKREAGKMRGGGGNIGDDRDFYWRKPKN